MSGDVHQRLTVDEIEPDAEGELLATLVSDDGKIAVIPLAMLPEGVRVNQVIDATFALTDAEGERRRRIEHLQHRLFDRDRDRER